MKTSIYTAIIFLLLTDELVVAKTITSDTNHEKKKKQTKRRLQNQNEVTYDNTDMDTRQNIQGARARTGRREQYESASPITDEDMIANQPAEEALTIRAQKKLTNQLAREEHNTNARQTERRKRENAEDTDVNDVPELTTSSMQMNQRTQKLQNTEATDLEFITPTASTANQEIDEMVQQSSSNVLAVKGPRTNQNEKKTMWNKQVSTPIPTYYPTYSTYHPTPEMQEGGEGDTEQTSRQNDNQMPTYYPTYSTYMPTPGDESTSNNMNTKPQDSSGSSNSGGGGSSNNDSQQTYQPTGKCFVVICAYDMCLFSLQTHQIIRFFFFTRLSNNIHTNIKSNLHRCMGSSISRSITKVCLCSR